MAANNHRSIVDKNHLRSAWPFLLLGSILIFFSMVIDRIGNSFQELAKAVVGELGVALVIAAVVYLAFEAAAKRNHDKSILAYLYGLNTDHAYFRVIEDYIIRCPFYRTGTKVTYRFAARRRKSYLIEYITEFRVRNISQVTKQYCVSGAVDTKSIYVGDTGDWELGVIAIEFPERRDIPIASFTRGEPLLTRPHLQEFRAQPVVLPPNHSLKVRIVQKIAKHDHDSDVWQAAIPSDGVTLRIEWPEKWGIQLGHEAIHPNEKFLKVKKRTQKGRCVETLVLMQPFLERHGVHFSWVTRSQRKSPAAPRPLAVPVDAAA